MRILIILASLLLCSSALPRHKRAATNDLAGDELFVGGDKGQLKWNEMAKDILESHYDNPQLDIVKTAKAKNVILFIGDGMGIQTISAARIYSMQSKGTTLAFDTMPVTGVSRTYNTNAQVPDSAGTATAFLCGEKAKRRTLGVSQLVTPNDCNQTLTNKLDSILKHSIRAGKWTGMVTTTRITHATPAATFAHAAHRDYESDTERDDLLREENYGPADTAQCPDIAAQLIDDEENQQIRVILGGGRRSFLPDTTLDPEYNTTSGRRGDGRNLTQIWQDQKGNDRAKYVWKKDDFDAVNPDETDYLMGLFEPSHMNFELDREDDVGKEPSLSEMTDKAIRILQRSDEGYFLLVEGGRIDHAHHDTKVVKALSETVMLSEAIEVAQELTDVSDTLIVVTADHSHAMTINGYPYINSSITGLAREEDNSLVLMQDGKPFSTLSYTNGPGFLNHRTSNYSSEDMDDIPFVDDDEVLPRLDLTDVAEVGDKDFFYDAAMYKSSETHGGEDVAVYASGPLSRMFIGTYEQHYIAHAMMYVSCVGEYTDRDGCDYNSNGGTTPLVSMTTMLATTLIALVQLL